MLNVKITTPIGVVIFTFSIFGLASGEINDSDLVIFTFHIFGFASSEINDSDLASIIINVKK